MNGVPTGADAPVMVAVNGSDGSLAAVRYAARIAARQGCELHIVHVAPSYLPITGLVPVASTAGFQEFEALGHEILKASAKEADSILPRDQVKRILRCGYRVTEVLEIAETSRLVVLGDDRTPLLARFAVGGFIGAVAARAPAPCVSVPGGWQEPTGERRVVLAVKDAQRIPFDFLRAGFQAAAEHHAALGIAHVWDLQPGYGALVTQLMDDPPIQTMIEKSVRAMARPLRDEFPDVSYTTRSWYGQPARILGGRAQGAVLLLLARREHAFLRGHLGGTGRALLRGCACPVEVLPIAERAPRASTHHADG